MQSAQPSQIRPFHICMLIDSWYPIEGGGQVHTKELCCGLAKKYDFRVDIFTRKLKDENGKCFNKNEELEDGKIRLFRLGFCAFFENLWARIWYLVVVIFAVLKKHRLFRYDLIHAQAFTPGLSAKILSLITKIPVIYSVHGTSLGLKKRGIYPFIEKFLLTKIRYDQVISDSHHFLEFSNINKNIAVIPNGVNVCVFEKVKANKTPFLKALFVGRFDEIKGLDLIIMAIKELLGENENLLKNICFQFHLVGYGPQIDRLMKMVKEYELEKFVVFKGRKEGEALIQEYKESDLFILPSRSEGNPITLFEAWAAKLPVLVTKVGDNSRYVEEEVNGFVVSPENVEALKEGLQKALSFDNLNKLGENGFKIVKERYSWEAMVDQTVKIYRKVLVIKK